MVPIGNGSFEPLVLAILTVHAVKSPHKEAGQPELFQRFFIAQGDE
jgi:hypothetical protein